MPVGQYRTCIGNTDPDPADQSQQKKGFKKKVVHSLDFL
jgi:hypothetical protein